MKRWLKRVGVVLGVLAALVLCALVGAWLYVTSDSGAERVRTQLLGVLGKTLAGRFEAKQLTLRGGVIVLENVKLFTPEGELVGEIRHGEIDASLWPLLGKRVVVRSAKLEGVRLYLQHDERGLNLVRAVAALHPSTSSGAPAAFHVDVRKLDLSDSFVSYPPYALSKVALAGGAVVAGPELHLDGQLAGSATLDGETPLPLSLAVGSKSESPGVKFDVVLGLGDAKLDGTLHIPKVAAEVRALEIPPDVARRFVPSSPVTVPLKATGHLDLETAALALEAGHARAAVQASYAGTVVQSLALEAHDVDLSELLGQGRPSRIELKANGRLSDARPASLDGALNASATWKTPDGRALADLMFDAEAVQGRATLKRADVMAPGAALRVTGKASLATVDLDGELDAQDLSALSAVIAELAGSTPPPLGGHGRLRLAVSGPARHPSVVAHGHFDSLRAASVQASVVQADIDVPDVMRPFEAQVDLDAATLVVAERTLENVHAHVGTKGRDLGVELSTRGFEELQLTAHGQVDEDARGIALAALSLRYPEEEWTLQAPTHLDLGDGFVLDLTRLAAADQRIELRASQKDGRLDVGLDAQRVDLGKLPRALLPETLNLHGLLSLHATAVGASSSPKVDAQVSVRDGTVRNVSKISVDVNGSYAKDRVDARAEGTSSMGSLKADIDVPLKGEGPLKAHVAVSGVLLEQLGPLLEKELPMSGQVVAVLDATGTAKKPRATLHLEVTGGAWRLDDRPAPGPKPAVADRADNVGVTVARKEIRAERLVLDVTPDPLGHLEAQLAAHAFGAQADIKLGTELTLEQLRERVPDLRAQPFNVTADVKELHLSKLVEAQLITDDVGGRVSFTLHGKGTAQHPDVEGTVSFTRLHSGRLKPQDGQLSLVATRSETRVHVQVGQSVLRLDADAKLPLERFLDVDSLATTTFVADGSVGPFTLNDVLDATPDQPHPAGSVQATLKASGTAVGPKVEVRGTLDHVALGKAPLGHADLALDYADAVTTLTAALVNEAAGRMDAKGTLKLDLSQPAVLKGLDWKGAPLAVDLESKGLELKWLSGVSDKVPRVEGRLDANAHIGGRLGDPGFTGHATWKQGTLAVMGYGEYREVDVEVDGSDEAVTLEKLYAKSSGGFVKLEGAALKREKAWQLNLRGETKSFPIIVDDQLKATASVEVQASGTATSTLIDLDKIVVPRATIELPEVKTKDLQDLDRPTSIVLVRNGVPLNAAQQKKLRFGPGAGTRQPAAPKTAVRLRLQAPRNLWVKGSDMQVEVGLSDGFEVSLDGSAQLSGDVSVKRGRIDVLSRRFDVDNTSTVHFSGAPNRAYVNVTATHKNEREGVVVTATVTGQLPQFAIHLSSNPPMAESDIFTLLATGRRQLKEGASQSITSDQAASVIGALAASQIKGVLAKKVPIDVLSVEAGADGLKGTRVEAGKYVTDQVYIGAEVRYGADPKKGENNAAAKLEYQFTPHWSLDVYGGDAGAFGADIVWSRDY